jgi:hypothetical protein
LKCTMTISKRSSVQFCTGKPENWGSAADATGP